MTNDDWMIGTAGPLRGALQAEAFRRIQQDGWFDAGMLVLNRMREAYLDNLHRELEVRLCWFVPPRLLFGAFGSAVGYKGGATLAGLPVYPAGPDAPPGLAFALPVCNRDHDCPAHQRPPVSVDHLWVLWAARHSTHLVVRAGEGLPAGWLDQLDGRWYKKGTFVDTVGSARVWPVSKFEVRDDGVIAQVYEVQP